MSVGNWLPKSRAVIASAFGDEADLFCRLLAATSPVTDIRANVSLACKAYQHLHWFGAIQPDGFIHVHVVSINKFLDNKLVTVEDCVLHKFPKYTAGRKMWSVYQNLIGNEDVCPVDRWILRHYGYKGDTRITVELYNELEQRIREEAKALGITPALRQIQLWSENRELGAINSKASRGEESYGDILERKKITRESLLRRLV